MINVVKADGSREDYNEEKVLRSIERARIPSNIRQEILTEISSKLYNDIPTREIYGHITEYLGKSHYPFSKSVYSLKHSIMDLGPTGYPFEDFISEIFSVKGYNTKVRQILSGKCIQHEVDIIAEKDNKTIMVEAKFHNSLGTRTEVHVPMYTKSRFEDLREKNGLHEAWVITNTKMTTDAIAFADCVGMRVISWNYPDNQSLRDMVEQYRLHPVTLLTSINNYNIKTLLDNHIILCKTVLDNPDKLVMLNLSKEQRNKLMDEVYYICGMVTIN